MIKLRNRRGKSYLSIATIMILTLSIGLEAKPITEQEAKNVALNWMQTIGKKSFKIKQVVDDNILLKNLKKSNLENNSNSYLKLIKLEPKGWVLVSGDTLASPIIGYSVKNDFNENDLPIQLEKMLEGFYKNIDKKRLNPMIKISSTVTDEWNKLKESPETYQAKYFLSKEKEILNTSKKTYWKLSDSKYIRTPAWSQTQFYNALTPVNNSATQPYLDGHAFTGCVATAMSIIMKTNSWPNIGEGWNRYTPSGYPQQFANFGSTSYNWGAMPMTNLTNYNNNVATIMHHTGVSVNMHYGHGNNASASSSFLVPNILENNFRYRTYGELNKDNFSEQEWFQMLKTDLRQGYPIYFDYAGHAFVIDGFFRHDSLIGTYFHMNYGHGGGNDGWYLLSGLNSGTHCATFGIKPNTLTDAYENDNSWRTSSAMRVNGEITRQNKHSIQPRTDSDWINFYNPRNQTVTIETLNSSGDTVMGLYDYSGNRIAYDDDGGTGYLSKISKRLTNGKYYLKINSYGNRSTISSYDVKIR